MMNGLVSSFLIVSSIIFAVTAFILIVFPVETYERVRDSRELSDSSKGLFAQTVISMYHIKRFGFDAEPKYWWHMLWFNTITSAIVSLGITTGIFLVLGIIFIILVAIAVFVAFSIFFNNI